MGNKLHPILIILLAVCVMFLNGCTDANLKNAKRYQKEKAYDQAIHFYTLALEKDPDSNSVRYGLIEAYSQRLIEGPPEQVTPERVEETMAELRPIAEPLMSDPSVRRYVSLVYQMMAKNYAEKGRDDKAAEAWAKVVEIEPSFAEAQYNLGIALTRTGNHEEALPYFEKAVNLNPYFVKGYYAMGNSLGQLNRDGEAITQYLKALELNPDDPSLRHDLGVAYFRTGEKEKAIEEFEKALEIEPGFVLAYRSLIGAYTDLGETEKAKEAAKKWEEYVEALKKAREAIEDQASPTNS